MYAMNIQNDIIGLVLHENCKSKQMTDFIAWPSRCLIMKPQVNIVSYVPLVIMEMPEEGVLVTVNHVLVLI
jgi:hypothetical protein